MVKDNITIEGARIGFRNFAGKESQFNPNGNKHFSIFLDHKLGETLENDGWNIKWLEPREEGDPPTAHMQVGVSFANIPPKVIVVTSGGKTRLNDETIPTLDWAEISNVDIIIRPYNWAVGKKTGVKAYVKTMYVTVVEDEFESKYNNIGEALPFE